MEFFGSYDDDSDANSSTPNDVNPDLEKIVRNRWVESDEDSSSDDDSIVHPGAILPSKSKSSTMPSASELFSSSIEGPKFLVPLDCKAIELPSFSRPPSTTTNTQVESALPSKGSIPIHLKSNAPSAKARDSECRESLSKTTHSRPQKAQSRISQDGETAKVMMGLRYCVLYCLV